MGDFNDMFYGGHCTTSPSLHHNDSINEDNTAVAVETAEATQEENSTPLSFHPPLSPSRTKLNKSSYYLSSATRSPTTVLLRDTITFTSPLRKQRNHAMGSFDFRNIDLTEL